MPRPSDPGAEPLVCGFANDHDGPHEWAAAPAHASASRAALDPKSIRDVVEVLVALYGDEEAALALAYGGVPGGRYPGLTMVEVCCSAEGRYDVWAATKAMADGAFA